MTVDSMMHTYHLYFSYLMKKTERDYLSETLAELSEAMLENSVEQYEELRGSEWEEAAMRNVAFFSVGAYRRKFPGWCLRSCRILWMHPALLNQR